MADLSAPRARILVVDDEESVRALLCAFLNARGFEVAEAPSGEGALALLEEQTRDVVLSDVRMPGMTGMQLLAEIRRRYPDVAVLMLTGCEEVSMAVDAMKLGAFDYLVKPFDLATVESSVRNALHRRSAERREAGRLRRLEQELRGESAELRGLLARASETTLEALVAALDARERETRAHSQRVAAFTVHLARRLGISGSRLEVIRRGALLHDVGKIGISDTILLKPAPLTEAEWEEMRRHPAIGHWILSGIEGLESASEIVLSHHERFDGRGYPRGLRGEAIPMGARIFSVVDSFDAIVSDRPYQRGQSFETARDEIIRNSGAQFDPAVVEAFCKVPVSVWDDLRALSLAAASVPAADLPCLVPHDAG
jgi:putative nucleotidyltransferase with HDIG domain